MKYCTDLPELPGMPCCCESCHEDGCDCAVEYEGEEYEVCCRVANFIQDRARSGEIDGR
jgi:hypothetical protein